MYGLKISALVALAASVHQVAAAPPACLLACVAQVEKASSCDSLSDLSCICSSEENAINKCLDSICPNGDADAAKAAFTDSCSGKASSSAASSSTSSSGVSSDVSSDTSESGSFAPSTSTVVSSDPDAIAAARSAEVASVASVAAAAAASAEGSASAAAAAAKATRVQSRSATSSATVNIVPSGAANQLGQSIGAAAVVGLMGALL